MATNKNNLQSALAAKQPAPDTELTSRAPAPTPPKQPLPAPMLSTDLPAPEPKKESKRKRGDGKHRPARGYTLDLDLIKQFQHIAIDEGKNLYEVMEEALQQYLDRRSA